MNRGALLVFEGHRRRVRLHVGLLKVTHLSWFGVPRICHPILVLHRHEWVLVVSNRTLSPRELLALNWIHWELLHSLAAHIAVCCSVFYLFVIVNHCWNYFPENSMVLDAWFLNCVYAHLKILWIMHFIVLESLAKGTLLSLFNRIQIYNREWAYILVICSINMYKRLVVESITHCKILLGKRVFCNAVYILNNWLFWTNT